MMTRKTTRNIGWVVWVVSFISLLAIGGCKDNKKSAGCEPGTIDCACIEGDAGSTCDEGLACVDGICQGEDSVGVSVGDESTRSCEVLITESGARVIGLTLDETVKGTFVRQQPKVAVTFIALKDEPIGATAIRVRTAAGEEGPIEVTKSECFDAQGEKLEGAAVSLGE